MVDGALITLTDRGRYYFNIAVHYVSHSQNSEEIKIRDKVDGFEQTISICEYCTF